VSTELNPGGGELSPTTTITLPLKIISQWKLACEEAGAGVDRREVKVK
jgi:hypothetical protein